MDAEEFRRIRKKLGLTQADAAEVLGFACATVISNIETGFREPNRLATAIFSLLDELPLKDAQVMVDRLAMKQRIVRHSARKSNLPQASTSTSEQEQNGSKK